MDRARNARPLGRREFLAFSSWTAGLGLATTAFPRALWAQVQAAGAPRVTPAMIEQAEHLAGADGQVDAVHDAFSAERLGEAARVEERFGGHVRGG